jgi:hypothetical protein
MIDVWAEMVMSASPSPVSPTGAADAVTFKDVLPLISGLGGLIIGGGINYVLAWRTGRETAVREAAARQENQERIREASESARQVESAQWTRNQRASAYADAVRVYDQVQRASYFGDDGDIDRHWDELLTAESTVDLLGPREVIRAGNRTRKHLADWAAADSKAEDYDVKKWSDKYWDLRQSYVLECRKVLGVV